MPFILAIVIVIVVVIVIVPDEPEPRPSFVTVLYMTLVQPAIPGDGRRPQPSVDFAEEVVLDVKACLRVRCPLPGRVFFCHQEHRAGFTTGISSRTLPGAALVCQNCGNNHFISLAVATPNIVNDVT
jgi:hypothetical protein